MIGWIASEIGCFYDTPYIQSESGLISASSYIPFLLLIAMVPVKVFTVKRLRYSDTMEVGEDYLVCQ